VDLLESDKPLHPQIRNTLAELFAPDDPSPERPDYRKDRFAPSDRRLDFVPRNPKQKLSDLGAMNRDGAIARTKIAERVYWSARDAVAKGQRPGGAVDDAIALAAKGAGVSDRTIWEFWPAYRRLLEKLYGPIRARKGGSEGIK
jgi:hypothetical protein